MCVLYGEVGWVAWARPLGISPVTGYWSHSHWRSPQVWSIVSLSTSCGRAEGHTRCSYNPFRQSFTVCKPLLKLVSHVLQVPWHISLFSAIKKLTCVSIGSIWNVFFYFSAYNICFNLQWLGPTSSFTQQWKETSNKEHNHLRCTKILLTTALITWSSTCLLRSGRRKCPVMWPALCCGLPGLCCRRHACIKLNSCALRCAVLPCPALPWATWLLVCLRHCSTHWARKPLRPLEPKHTRVLALTLHMVSLHTHHDCDELFNLLAMEGLNCYYLYVYSGM